MSLRAIALCLSLVACTSLAAGLPPSRTANEIHVRAQVLSVQKAAGCGVILAGSLVTYQVVSGDRALVGKQVMAVVACIEIPQMSGKVSHFTAGDVQDLVLTKRNIYKIEVPSPISPHWFYLSSASAVD